jgi:hypothetical protein
MRPTRSHRRRPPRVPADRAGRDARLHGGQHLLDVQRGQATCGVKGQGVGTVPREHSVQPEYVGMEVEIERPTKPLDDGHGAAASIRHAVQARTGTQEPEHARTNTPTTAQHSSWSHAS